MDVEKSISRRSALGGAAAVVGAAAVSGLVPHQASAAAVKASPVVVSFWDNFVTQAPWVDNEIKIFEAVHPNITIKKTTQVSTTYDNLFALAVKSGNQPDTFIIPFTPALNEQVARGFVAPFDRYAGPSFKSRFPKGTFYEGSNVFNGKTYSAPLSGHAPLLLLYINNGVFRKAGLINADGSIKVPRTYDDMTAAAAAIAAKIGGSTYGFGYGNSAGVFLGFFIDVLVRGAGAPAGLLESIDYRVGRSTLSTNPAYEQAINLVLGWKNKGYIYPNAQGVSDEVARAFFERDRFGMLADGVWCEGEWTQHKFTDYTVTDLPSPTGTPRAVYYYQPGGFQFGLSPHAAHPAEAFLWLDHLYSVEAGRRWVHMGNDLSAFPQNNVPANIPYKPFAQYVATSKYALPRPEPTIRNPQIAHVTPAAVTPNVYQVVTNILTGQTSDVKGALASLDAAQNKALADAVAAAQKQGFKVSLSDYAFPDWNPTKPYYTKPR